MAALRLSWGGWRTPSAVRLKWGGNWITPQKIYVRWGGSWVQIWSSYTPFQASLSPSWLMGSYPQTTNGSISRGYSVSCSGGTGNYSVVSRSVSGGASHSGSGLSGTVSASGRNTTYTGTFTVVVTDGVTQITLTGNYEYSFGTPL